MRSIRSTHGGEFRAAYNSDDHVRWRQMRFSNSFRPSNPARCCDRHVAVVGSCRGERSAPSRWVTTPHPTRLVSPAAANTIPSGRITSMIDFFSLFRLQSVSGSQGDRPPRGPQGEDRWFRPDCGLATRCWHDLAGARIHAIPGDQARVAIGVGALLFNVRRPPVSRGLGVRLGRRLANPDRGSGPRCQPWLLPRGEPPVWEFESRDSGQTQRFWLCHVRRLRGRSGHQPVPQFLVDRES